MTSYAGLRRYGFAWVTGGFFVISLIGHWLFEQNVLLRDKSVDDASKLLSNKNPTSLASGPICPTDLSAAAFTRTTSGPTARNVNYRVRREPMQCLLLRVEIPAEHQHPACFPFPA